MIEHSAIVHEFDNPGSLCIYCPGCKITHVIYVDSAFNRERKLPVWGFNGDYEKPTFTPSLLVRYNWGPEQRPVVCHSFITDGQIQYLSDSTHALKNQTAALGNINEAD